MESLGEIRKQFLENLTNQYTQKEIDIIFYALAENYLHKDKSILKLGLHELVEESYLKSLLFQSALVQLIEGKPYQYVVGSTEFFGCKIIVNPSVLIPRPETEELVEWIIEDCKNKGEIKTIIDLCSGSGCIGIALAKNIAKSIVSSLELSEKAIETAQKNIELNQVKMNLIQADLLKSEEIFTDMKFDIIVSNPPYIREFEKEAMEDKVLKYEPYEALFVSDEDPLIFYQKINDFALKHLNPLGKIYVEINQELAEKTKDLFIDYFSIVELKQDLSGNFRMIKAEGLLL